MLSFHSARYFPLLLGLLLDERVPRRFLFSPLFWLLGLGILGGLLFTVRLPHRRLAGGATALVAVFFVVLLVWSARMGSAMPLMEIQVTPGGQLNIALPGRQDDLIEEHGYPMEIFAVREPQMDVLLHLHPMQTGPGIFIVQLPSIAGGPFLLFADVVHRDGTAETFTAKAELPAQTGPTALTDGAVVVVPGLAAATPTAGPAKTTVRLPDGYAMTLQLAAALHPKTGQVLHFALLDTAGNSPADTGMNAHAIVVKTDGTVFAQIHSSGTMPGDADGRGAAFLFSFPSAGNYRVFVEMKRAGLIETGAFDLTVLP